jgi:redox-sensitive bicupin YhaK (pirin superfamily)
MGNTGRTGPGDVQVMSAGAGVRHAEYNMETDQTTLFQIWIEPTTRGGDPYWGAKPFPKDDRTGRFVPLASGFDADKDIALPIRAEARVLGATLKTGEVTEYPLDPARHAYLVSAKGSVEVNGVRLDPRDGVAVTGETALTITALDDAELVLVDAA